MATPLGFSIWRDEDDFCAPGQTATLYDGQCVSLLHKAKNYIADSGKDISEISFKIQLEKDGQVAAEHSFTMEKMSSFWLIADPAESDENGTFTVAFINELANTPDGNHNYTVKLFGDDELINEGSLIYKSNGQNEEYKALLLKFNDVSATRDQANQEHQQEYAQQLAKEDAEQQAAREFTIFIENQDTGHTKYVVCTNQSSLSEDIHEVLPRQTLMLNLFRSSKFELKYYDQDGSKEYASFIETVDESFHEAKYSLT